MTLIRSANTVTISNRPRSFTYGILRQFGNSAIMGVLTRAHARGFLCVCVEFEKYRIAVFAILLRRATGPMALPTRSVYAERRAN